MDRAELERLDREGLVMRAQAAGVKRARLLTRPELVDELLRLDPSIDPTQLKRTRGLFGRARDLLSRVVERGLHLPDAADRLRAALGSSSPFPDVQRPEPQAVPTVTLAEIYAAQGHKQRAMETLRRVLEAEPDHGGARALLVKLEAVDYVAPEPPLPPETDETARDEIGGNLVPAPRSESPETESPATESAAESHTPAAVLDEPPTLRRNRPETGERDECVAIPIGHDCSYVWWRLSAATLQLLADDTFFVRALILHPTWTGPEHELRDTSCDPAAGELLLHRIPAGAVVRIAVGVLDTGKSTFVPFAHSPAIESTEASDGRALVRRTLEGATPIALEDPHSASIATAAERAARVAEHAAALHVHA
jgi:hypothetical protein